jgi:hypothetical protein
MKQHVWQCSIYRYGFVRLLMHTGLHTYALLSVAIVSGCRSTGPGFDSRSYQTLLEALRLEWCPLNRMRIN